VLIVPARHAVLASEISARIKGMAVDAGERFSSGQPLVVLDTALYQARTQRAAAEYDAAEKSLAIHSKLSALGSVSELEMVTAQGRMEAARADLALEQKQMDLGTINAPFDGRVVTRVTQPHEYVTPGQPLMEIVGRFLKLQLHLPSVWLRWLKPGIGFKVAVDETGQTYPAQITRLGGRVDPVSQTIEVWAQIKGTYPELLAGMSGVCRFEDQGGQNQ
jgi:RND family efflux transporter MFP subunit